MILVHTAQIISALNIYSVLMMVMFTASGFNKETPVLMELTLPEQGLFI